MPYMTREDPCKKCGEVNKETWNNFAVIPRVENLRKGNNHTVHD